MKIKIILLAFAMMLAMAACTPSAPAETPDATPTPSADKALIGESSGEIFQNDHIDETLRETIKKLDDELITNMQNGDTKAVMAMCLPSTVGSESQMNQVVQMYKGYLKDKTYAYEERYFFDVNASGGSSNVMAISDKHGYIVHATAYDGGMFFSFIKVPNEAKESLMTVVYLKDQGAWKVASLFYNDYTYYSMDAVALYKKAKELRDKGQELSAAMYIDMINRTLQPSRNIQYHEMGEISQFIQALIKDVQSNYVFPISVENTNTLIYSFGQEIVVDGIMPAIGYVTSLDVSDESEANKAAMEKEAKEFHEKVMVMYPELKENFNIFHYRAYSEPPDGKKPVKGYGTVIQE